MAGHHAALFQLGQVKGQIRQHGPVAVVAVHIDEIQAAVPEMRGRVRRGGADVPDVGERRGARLPLAENRLHRGLVAGEVAVVIAVDPRVHRHDLPEMGGKDHGAFPGIRPDLDGPVPGALLFGPVAQLRQPAFLHVVAHGGDRHAISSAPA